MDDKLVLVELNCVFVFEVQLQQVDVYVSLCDAFERFEWNLTGGLVDRRDGVELRLVKAHDTACHSEPDLVELWFLDRVSQLVNRPLQENGVLIFCQVEVVERKWEHVLIGGMLYGVDLDMFFLGYL